MSLRASGPSKRRARIGTVEAEGPSNKLWFTPKLGHPICLSKNPRLVLKYLTDWAFQRLLFGLSRMCAELYVSEHQFCFFEDSFVCNKL